MMRAVLLLVAALLGGPVAAQPQLDAREAYRLGLMHRNGAGVPKDAVLAASLIGIAAQGQVPAAMFTLSNLLAAGEGVARDALAARRWLETAAALGYPAALQQLALTEPDPRKAELLMRQAGHALQHTVPGQ
ncbi:tetratricopeptide repeat protein [Massilia niabensis]|uniref:Tetratricopeptide repeat protein n=1 Tax=Massilia niabensis TaxID=544910 RepID=A0ABW0L759_9BURK